MPISEETKKKLEAEAKAKREAEEKKKSEAKGTEKDNKEEVDPFKVIPGEKGDTSKTEKVGNQTVFDPQDFKGKREGISSI